MKKYMCTCFCFCIPTMQKLITILHSDSTSNILTICKANMTNYANIPLSVRERKVQLHVVSWRTFDLFLDRRSLVFFFFFSKGCTVRHYIKHCTQVPASAALEVARVRQTLDIRNCKASRQEVTKLGVLSFFCCGDEGAFGWVRDVSIFRLGLNIFVLEALFGCWAIFHPTAFTPEPRPSTTAAFWKSCNLSKKTTSPPVQKHH